MFKLPLFKQPPFGLYLERGPWSVYQACPGTQVGKVATKHVPTSIFKATFNQSRQTPMGIGKQGLLKVVWQLGSFKDDFQKESAISRTRPIELG